MIPMACKCVRKINTSKSFALVWPELMQYVFVHLNAFIEFLAAIIVILLFPCILGHETAG
jgi:hypothetical protein